MSTVAGDGVGRVVDVVVVGELVETDTDLVSGSLTLAEASELTARIGQALEHAELLIAQAYIRRVWEPLGLPSWNAYVDQHFGDRPILTVPRQDRQTVVQSLSESGMSDRAIGRAIGVDHRTVGRDLRGVGGEYSPPDQGSGAGVECPTCGELHPSDVGTCPYLESAFGPIIDLDDAPADRSEQRFGRPATGSDETTDGDADEADTNVDSEDDPLPDAGPAADDPARVAAARSRRLRAAVARVAALRDDLDELADLVAEMRRDVTDWPDPAGGPPADPLAVLRAQVAAVRAALPRLPGWLDEADALSQTWEAVTR